MGTIFKGTETNYTTIDAPFEPAPNNTTTGGAATTWPSSPTNNGYSSYYRILNTGTWRYASSTYTNAMVGPAGNMGPELYYLHRIAKRIPAPGGDIWPAVVNGPAGGYEGYFYFEYANTPTANTVRKMMLLVDDSPIDPTNFYARIVKWEKPTLSHVATLDTQLQNRWLINDDYTSATYYATNTPSLKTSDFEASVTATYSIDGTGGYPPPIPQSPQNLVLGLSGFATDVMFGDRQVSSIHLNGKEVWYSSTYNKIRTAMQQGPVITSSDYPENTLVFARDTRNLLYYTGGNWHVVGHDGLNQIVVVEYQSEATSSTTYPDNSLLYAKDTTNLLIYMGGNWHIIEN